MAKRLRLAVVAGEPSGDKLGAAVIEALRDRCDDLQVEGIGGPEMIAAGCNSVYPMERLSVMGFVEPLRRLPELLRIRTALVRRWQQTPPDLFLGIDAPDFNLGLEKRLRASRTPTPNSTPNRTPTPNTLNSTLNRTPTPKGTPTAHLVSPSVWAWRKGRVRTIRRAVDAMLCLFPFETEFYREQHVPCRFVGHPLADTQSTQPDRTMARAELRLGAGKVIALLPGSRAAEIALLAPLFLDAAERLYRQDAKLRFLLPAANQERYQELQSLLAQRRELPVQLLDGQTTQVLAASDAVLVASGTATLEAALSGCPMVVAYRMGRVNWWLLSRMVGVPFVALPNLLLGREVVPEYLQDAATAESLAVAIAPLLYDARARERMQADLALLQPMLQKDCAAQVAQALLELAER